MIPWRIYLTLALLCSQANLHPFIGSSSFSSFEVIYYGIYLSCILYAKSAFAFNLDNN